MSTYTTRDVADLLGVEIDAVRRYASSAELDPEREKGRRYGLTFQDMVLIRTALELAKSGVAHHRIHESLRRLREQLPTGQPMTAVRISTDGAELLVKDGSTVWSPESGQVVLELATPAAGAEVTSLDRRRAKPVHKDDPDLSADEWYELGCALIDRAPVQAAEAFRKAVALAPDHADAHVNLGYLVQREGRHEEAEAEYRAALESDPACAIAAYNLGVVLEDAECRSEARDAYGRAIEIDPELADAHFNLSRLSEELGDRAAALRHLRSYSRLLRAARAP